MPNLSVLLCDMFACATIGLGVVLLSCGLASAGELPRLSHTLTFDAARTADDPAAEAFFTALDKNDGQIVFLDLTIEPDTATDPAEPGYDIVSGGYGETGGGHAIICGRDGTLGLVDNLSDTLTVTTRHPHHFHAPVTLIVGDRMRFAHQHIACSAQGYLDNALTPLIVRGYFSIQSGDIPTAREYRLTPANPH